MKKRFPVLIGFLAVVIGVIAVGSSLGWFQIDDTGRQKAQLIEYGDMDYTLVGGCDIHPAYIDESSNEYAAPGENMIYSKNSQDKWVPGPLKVLNKSTITTNLRVKIEYSWWNSDLLPLPGLVTVVYSPTQNADFTVDFAVPANWVFDSGTGFWNYLPGGNSIPAVADPVNGEEITLINSMGYSSAITVGSHYETKNVNVSLKVEAKQADYADWTDVSA